MSSSQLTYPEYFLSERQQCDLELLLNGAFSPLTGYLVRKDYQSVLDNMRLSTGELWPMPITLSVKEADLKKYQDADFIALKDLTGITLAHLKIEDVYKPDLVEECVKVFGTDDDNHPYVSLVLEQGDVYYLGGKVEKVNDPLHFDFKDLRKTPAETKKYFAENGWNKVLAFQTRNPMHRSHFELTKYALSQVGDENAKLLLHPVVGVTQDCDVDYHTRVRCYQKLLKYYGENSVLLSLLPLSMRMGGPREAVWHALIRKNYGATHFVVGRDHAGPSYKKKNGESFYGPYEAQELLEKYKEEVGIEVILSKMIVHVKEDGVYLPIDQVPEGKTVENISGTEQRRLLKNGEPIPEWFTFPEIVDEMRNEYKKIGNKGLCLYFVGLSGSGKSTIANYVKQKLLEIVLTKNITLLDGDVVRQHLSKGLGFSKEDRSVNIQRIGYVASEIVKHGGICLCANIAPYNSDRKVNRKLISSVGNYVEIFVDTSLDKCEERDVKGLYKLAREGKIKQFTGISDPFEVPENAEMVLNGADNLDTCVEKVISYLQDNGLI